MKKKEFIPSEEYKKILELMPICCVDIIVYHNGKVLLIKRKDEPGKAWWWTPGGRILKNESVKDAVIRKAKEEAGIDIEIINLVAYFDFFSDNSAFGKIKNKYHTISLVFLTKPKNENQKIILDKTSIDYKWIDKIEDDLHPTLKNFLKEANLFV